MFVTVLKQLTDDPNLYASNINGNCCDSGSDYVAVFPLTKSKHKNKTHCKHVTLNKHKENSMSPFILKVLRQFSMSHFPLFPIF
jgi:hypothetical protein